MLRITEPPGARTLAAVPPVRRDNLPAEISSFVGREAAITQIVGLLGEHRLVTLSGAPGVGKTRLALRVAAELRERFDAGVWNVELAALSEPALVPVTVAATLGLREDAQQPALGLICERLGMTPTLLLLDNCEHLPEACAALADELLRSCSGLRILVTSREPLGLTGEVCWTVQPLSLPPESAPASAGMADRTPGPRRRASQGGSVDAPHGLQAQVSLERVSASEAGRLFVERARAVRPTLALNADAASAIAKICRRLDGIPLAIELAAARVAALTPAEIAARLDDRFHLLGRTGRAPLPRQRTLRASVDWSYDLLSESERRLLRRLAVFRGGWSLDAVEGVGCWVIGDGGDEGVPRSPNTQHPTPSTLDLLTLLVEKSLVLAEERDGETRYAFLETIRAYATDRLRGAGEYDALAQRHRDWCVALAEEAANYLRTPSQVAWRARLALEQDNIRAALDRTIERDEAEPGLRLCIALWHFWIDRGDAAEGYVWLTRLLALESAQGRTVVRAAALFVAAKLAFEGGDLATAQALGEESLEIAREVGDLHTQHRVMTQLGHIARGRGEWQAAARHYEEALPIRRDLGEPVDVAVSLACLGHVRRAMREFAAARALYEESLAMALRQGHPAEITAAQHDLGRLAHEMGRDDEAAAWYAEALPVALRLNHPRRMAYLLEGFAALAVPGQPERALQLAAAATALRRASGSMLPPSDRAALERQLEPARGALSAERVEAAWQSGAVLGPDEAVQVALAPSVPALRSDTAAVAAPAPESASESTPVLSLQEQDWPDQLTAREREVVSLVARGHTNRQIAEALVVSERTAEWHVANTLSKLGLGTRAQLAVWAAQRAAASAGAP